MPGYLRSFGTDYLIFTETLQKEKRTLTLQRIFHLIWIRFTPRKPTSVWSKVNINKIEDLKKKGLMKKPGLEAFKNRKNSKSGIYSFENEITRLDGNFEEIFKANKNAWTFFTKQAPSYQKTRIHWVMSAKQETTRITRLKKLITASDKNIRLF